MDLGALSGRRTPRPDCRGRTTPLTSLADISMPPSPRSRIAGVLFELGWIKSKPHEIAADASWKMTVISDYMEVVHKETRRLVAAYEQGPDPAAARESHSRCLEGLRPETGRVLCPTAASG